VKILRKLFQDRGKVRSIPQLDTVHRDHEPTGLQDSHTLHQNLRTHFDRELVKEKNGHDRIKPTIPEW
jgi:hypothetical protein